MKTIIVDDEVVEVMDKLKIDYTEGNIVYKIDWTDIRPYTIGFIIGIIFGLLVALKPYLPS